MAKGNSSMSSSQSNTKVREITKGPGFSKFYELVTIYVATSEFAPALKTFVIHKEFACHYSPVFKAAFNSQFWEGQTQTYRIVDDAPESAVHLLVHWLYTQKVDLAQIDSSPNEMPESDHLVRLWVLADRLLIGNLQDAVIHELEERSIEYNSANVAALKYIYENTNPDSKLRRLLLHQCASHLDTATFTESAHLFPHEMLIELAILYSKTIRSTELKTLMPQTDTSLFQVATDQFEGRSDSTGTQRRQSERFAKKNAVKLRLI